MKPPGLCCIFVMSEKQTLNTCTCAQCFKKNSLIHEWNKTKFNIVYNDIWIGQGNLSLEMAGMKTSSVMHMRMQAFCILCKQPHQIQALDLIDIPNVVIVLLPSWFVSVLMHYKEGNHDH